MQKEIPGWHRGRRYFELSASDDSAIRPGPKKPRNLEEINRQNRLFWEARSKKFKRQIKRWPGFVEKALHKMEADALVYGIKSVRSFEYELDKKLVEQIGAGVRLTLRERKVWNVIQQGSRGKQYCRELHNARLKPCKSWVDDDCPSNYIEAYREGQPWRKRIQDEKHRIKNKAELIQLVEE